jgi:hypothetical protein
VVGAYSAPRRRRRRRVPRLANNALWRIALVRLHCHEPTKDYVARRTGEGNTKPEIRAASSDTPLAKLSR